MLLRSTEGVERKEAKKMDGKWFFMIFLFLLLLGFLIMPTKYKPFLVFRALCASFLCVCVYLCTVSFDCFGFVFPTSQFFLLLFLNLVTLWTENRLGEYCKQEGNHVGEYFICWRTINQSLYTKTHFFRLNPKDFIPIHFIAPYVY